MVPLSRQCLHPTHPPPAMSQTSNSRGEPIARAWDAHSVSAGTLGSLESAQLLELPRAVRGGGVRHQQPFFFPLKGFSFEQESSWLEGMPERGRGLCFLGSIHPTLKRRISCINSEQGRDGHWLPQREISHASFQKGRNEPSKSRNLSPKRCHSQGWGTATWGHLASEQGGVA